MADTKYCSCCKEVKPADAFRVVKSGKSAGKLQTYCKACFLVKKKESVERHKKKAAEYVPTLTRILPQPSLPETAVCEHCQETLPIEKFPIIGTGKVKKPWKHCFSCVSHSSRTCNICKETKPLDQYQYNRRGQFEYTCKPCDWARTNKWLRDRKERLKQTVNSVGG